MFAIVNQVIEEAIVENLGNAAWNEVKRAACMEEYDYISEEGKKDLAAFQMALSVSEYLDLPMSDVLTIFGEYWMLKVGREGCGPFRLSGENDLRTFLTGLPNFHTRIMLLFPELVPPEFKISSLGENDIQVHYYSKRAGLSDFVYGILIGLTRLSNTEATIERSYNGKEGFDHDIFSIRWNIIENVGRV